MRLICAYGAYIYFSGNDETEFSKKLKFFANCRFVGMNGSHPLLKTQRVGEVISVLAFDGVLRPVFAEGVSTNPSLCDTLP